MMTYIMYAGNSMNETIFTILFQKALLQLSKEISSHKNFGESTKECAARVLFLHGILTFFATRIQQNPTNFCLFPVLVIQIHNIKSSQVAREYTTCIHIQKPTGRGYVVNPPLLTMFLGLQGQSRSFHLFYPGNL